MLYNKPISNADKDASADATKTARAIVGLMKELTELMKEESDLLYQHKYNLHKELLKKKQRLTLTYRATMKTFSSQPDLLKRVPEEIRALVRETAQKLSDVAEGNARALRTAVLAIQRLLQSIMRIIKAEALPTSTYDNPKTKHLRLGNYSPKCTPVAVKRSV